MVDPRWSRMYALRVTLIGIVALSTVLIIHFTSRGIGMDQFSLIASVPFPSDVKFEGKLQFPFKSSEVTLQNIRNMEGNNVRPVFEDKAACVISFYAQIPIEPGGSHYYFYFTSIEHQFVDREIRSTLLDVTRNSLQSPSKADTAVFFIDPVKIPREPAYEQVRKWMACTYKGPTGLVPVFGKYFYYKDQENYGTSSLNKVVSYIANCYHCGIKPCEYGGGLDPMACFLMEDFSYPPLKSKSKGELLPPDTVLVPLTLDHMCRLSEDLIDILRHRVYTSSMISSIGTELWFIIEDASNRILIEENSTGIFQEIDFRATNLLSEYDYHCKPVSDSEKTMSSVHLPFLTEPFSKMQNIREGLYVIAEYTNGMKALFKILTQYLGTGHAFIQGISELCGHYMDLILGFYMTPLNVYRQLHMVQDCDPTCTKFTMEGAKVEGILEFDDTLKRADRFFNQSFHDPVTGKYLLHVDVIGWVKNMYERDTATKHFYRLDEDRKLIQAYFTHDITFEEFKRISQGTTKQDVKDISDVILFDFLNYNYDRAWTTNWARSGPRYMFFDNGGGLDKKLGRNSTYMCTRLLHCPRFFCPGNSGKECFRAPNDAQMCRFNKHALVRMKRVGPGVPESQRLGPRMWQLIQMEGWYFDGLRPYFGPRDVAGFIDERVSYAINYVNECVSRHGIDVFF